MVLIVPALVGCKTSGAGAVAGAGAERDGGIDTVFDAGAIEGGDAGPLVEIIAASEYPTVLAADDDDVYWGANSDGGRFTALRRAPTHPSAPVETFATADGVVRLLLLDSTHVVWQVG